MITERHVALPLGEDAVDTDRHKVMERRAQQNIYVLSVSLCPSSLSPRDLNRNTHKHTHHEWGLCQDSSDGDAGVVLTYHWSFFLSNKLWYEKRWDEHLNIALVSFHFTSSQSLVNLSFISYMDELCEGSSPLHAVLARLLDVGPNFRTVYLVMLDDFLRFSFAWHQYHSPPPISHHSLLSETTRAPLVWLG